MADNIYSQAYATQQSPDLAGALMDLKRSEELKNRYGQDANQFNDPNKMVGATTWMGRAAGLMNKYRENEAYSNMRNIQDSRVNPAMQQLIQSVMQAQQGMNIHPESTQQDMQNRKTLGAMSEWNVPGAAAQQEAYNMINNRQLPASSAVGGNMNPMAQAYARANIGAANQSQDILSRVNELGQNVMQTRGSMQQALDRGQAIPTSNIPLTQITRENNEVVNVPTQATINQPISQSTATQEANKTLMDTQAQYHNELSRYGDATKVRDEMLRVIDRLNTNSGNVNAAFNKVAKELNLPEAALQEYMTKKLNQYARINGTGRTDAEMHQIINSNPNMEQQARVIKELLTEDKQNDDFNMFRKKAANDFIARNQDNPNMSQSFKRSFVTKLNEVPAHVAKVPSQFIEVPREQQVQIASELSNKYGKEKAAAMLKDYVKFRELTKLAQ